MTKLAKGQKIEFQIETPDGLGFTIAICNGPVGLGIEITTPAGAPKVTNRVGTTYNGGEVHAEDNSNFEACQYRHDAYAQAFKAWYSGKAEYPGTREEFEAKEEAAELRRLAQGQVNIHSFDHS